MAFSQKPRLCVKLYFTKASQPLLAIPIIELDKIKCSYLASKAAVLVNRENALNFILTCKWVFLSERYEYSSIGSDSAEEVFLKKWAKPSLFLFIYVLFSHHKDTYSTNLAINDKSVDSMLGSQTRGSRNEGAD